MCGSSPGPALTPPMINPVEMSHWLFMTSVEAEPSESVPNEIFFSINSEYSLHSVCIGDGLMVRKCTRITKAMIYSLLSLALPENRLAWNPCCCGLNPCGCCELNPCCCGLNPCCCWNGGGAGLYGRLVCGC